MLTVIHRLSDGTVVLRDLDGDGARFTIRADQWATVAALPVVEQRGAVEAIVLARKRAEAAHHKGETE